MDVLTPEQRHKNMSRIRSSNTKPEKTVRSLLHRLGYRFRLNVRKLPGTPDIVLPKYKTVIFVHGCFWHRHSGCKEASIPKTNTEKWMNKFSENIQRDNRAVQALEQAGWSVFVIWECEIKNKEQLAARIQAALPSQEKRSK
ncbi:MULTISPECIES: very short patch repair endonuclease [unclassified Desulfovibrio]|uniref:very short patch repair endonuclease n=1 Tax=unclassified Desulfovibrio TaxID=2593640 RepID=UPI002FDAA05A